MQSWVKSHQTVLAFNTKLLSYSYCGLESVLFGRATQLLSKPLPPKVGDLIISDVHTCATWLLGRILELHQPKHEQSETMNSSVNMRKN